MDTEQEAARLLVEVYETTEGAILQSVRVQGESFDRLLRLIGHLQNAQLVNVTGIDGVTVALTAAGVVRAEQLMSDRDRPVKRYNRALNGLIMAAADSFPQHRLDLKDFLSSRHAQILNSILTQDEVLNAAKFLEEEDLVTVVRDGEEPVAVVLTSRGRRCGWNDQVDVMGFLDGKKQSGVQQHIAVTIHGNGTQVGQGNTQNNNFGYDPHQLAAFARAILAGAESMNVAEAAREQITKHARELEREAETAEPQKARIRDSLKGLKEYAAALPTPDVMGAVLQVLL
ncbi:hypothetical protein [Streptomyces sp. NPDC059071]|uniref:hypothetical protein n=1 Tax=unclassified Streptomyces TaxID=2593676 RepID=UPI003666A5C1